MIRYWSNPINTSQTQHYNHLMNKNITNIQDSFYLKRLTIDSKIMSVLTKNHDA
ncbi:MAG: hypothetical protein ACJA2G_001626 [Cognaticolwellia sp.]|jgi:hypothetical protein